MVQRNGNSKPAKRGLTFANPAGLYCSVYAIESMLRPSPALVFRGACGSQVAIHNDGLQELLASGFVSRTAEDAGIAEHPGNLEAQFPTWTAPSAAESPVAHSSLSFCAMIRRHVTLLPYTFLPALHSSALPLLRLIFHCHMRRLRIEGYCCRIGSDIAIQQSRLENSES